MDLNRALQLAQSRSKRSHSSEPAVGFSEQREIHPQPEMTLDSIVIQLDRAFACANPGSVKLPARILPTGLLPQEE
jgi:hypothetical protein